MSWPGLICACITDEAPIRARRLKSLDNYASKRIDSYSEKAG